MDILPKVSLILTVYNHEDFISDAIESVLNQTFSEYEIIIVNDGSTDNTRVALGKYENNPRIIIKNIDHSGRAKALNTGFKYARGKYITVLDSDDIYLPKKIEKQVSFLDKNPEIVLVGTNAIEIDLSSNSKIINRPPINDNKIRNLLLFNAVMPFPTIMTRRKVLKKIHCDENLPAKIDFDLIGKIAQMGKLAVIPENLVVIRRHSKNNFRNFPPEVHRICMLKVRFLNLWRLKPRFPLFTVLLLWHSFEYFIHLIPEKIRHLLPEGIKKIPKTFLQFTITKGHLGHNISR